MLFCAVARPKYDYTRNAYFDENFGIWAFVDVVPGKQTSKHILVGTLELGSINVKRESYKKFLIEKVLLAIRVSSVRKYIHTCTYI